MNKQRYCLTITYDGTCYQGWQSQTNGVSIQQKIESALHTLFQKKIAIFGSGRTDSGVHALDQKAHFDLDNKVDVNKLFISINALLPKDIRVLKIEPVADDFHARFSCKKKIYQYHIHRREVIDPFNKNYSLFFPYPLDIEKMKAASKYLIGVHDFSSFANKQDQGSAKNNPIKNLMRIDFVEKEFGLMIEYEADGFLYKMVRNITGTLLKVGGGKLTPEDVKTILEAKNRKKACAAADGKGLFLAKTFY